MNVKEIGVAESPGCGLACEIYAEYSDSVMQCCLL